MCLGCVWFHLILGEHLAFHYISLSYVLLYEQLTITIYVRTMAFPVSCSHAFRGKMRNMISTITIGILQTVLNLTKYNNVPHHGQTQ